MLDVVEDLIQQVRDVTDEDNEEDVSPEFIIRMLNRAQQDLVSEITRKYSPHFKSEVVLTSSDFSSDGTGKARVATLPPQAFAFRISSVDASISDAWLPVRQVPFNYTLALDSSTGSSLPTIYSIQRNKIYVYPGADAGVKVRIRYQMRPPKLVATEGRVVKIIGNTISLDADVVNLTQEDTSLNNFINIIDASTGAIKATLQIQSVSGKDITIKNTGLTRDVVFGYPVSTSMPEDIALDDYVTHASGTCIPYLASDLTNYHVELAAFHVKRALGTVDTPDFQERDRVIERISKMWSGRENTMKINRTRRYPLFHWSTFFRGS